MIAEHDRRLAVAGGLEGPANAALHEGVVIVEHQEPRAAGESGAGVARGTEAAVTEMLRDRQRQAARKESVDDIRRERTLAVVDDDDLDRRIELAAHASDGGP